MLKLIVSATLLLASAPVIAQSTAAAPQQAQQPQASGGIVFEDAQPAAKAKSRLVCHDVQEPGSRLVSNRICMTAEQWKDQQQRDRDLVADTQRNTTVVGSSH